MSEQQPVAGKSLLAMTDQAIQIERALISQAEANLGEINPELEALLAEVQEKLAQKADSYKYLIDRFKYSAEMLWSQAESFDRAAAQLDRASVRLKDRIKEVMLLSQSDEVPGINWTWRLKNNAPRLEIDQDKLPAEFIITRTIQEPDKNLIKAALKEGREIPGVSVVPVKALQAYVRKGD